MADDFLTSSKPAGFAAGNTAQPAVLDQVRSQVLLRLSSLTHSMFDTAEVVLFEEARNLPNTEQQRYMDIILEIKRKRDTLEQLYSSNLASIFMQFNTGAKPSAMAQKAQSFDFDSLSLVNSEEMDINVAVDTMVAKARMELATPLALLKRRYMHLLKREFDELPMDPAPVTKSFRETFSDLDVGIQEKIVVLRIFQQEVLSHLDDLIDDANQLLIDAGVLPDLKSAHGKGPVKAAEGKPAEAKRKPADAQDVLNILQDVLAVTRDAGGLGGGGGAPAAAPAAPSGPVVPGARYQGGQYLGGGGVGDVSAEAIGGSVAQVPLVPLNVAPTAQVIPVATPELVAMLSQIQQNQPKAPLVQDASSPSPTEVRESIRGGLKSDARNVEAIRQADEDVINLISMLFDFILDDDDLPTAMKALLGRLQIPLLKVAILDKTFFNAESHPARRLLNTLAKAGIGWSQRDPGGDALYAKIEEIVYHILNDFIDDISLFENLLNEFDAFYDQQQKREKALDKRTRDAEEGRARADLARAMVQQTLNRRLTGRQLPPVAVKLLQEAWRNVLYLGCLREGTESEAWKQAVKVVDALIWSVTPQPGAEWVTRLKNVSPKLLNSLKKGLAGVHYNELTTESLLRELAQVHLEMISGAETRTVMISESRTAPQPGSSTVVDAEKLSSADNSKVQEVVLPIVEATPPPPAPDQALAADDPHMLMVERLNAGSWLEFIEDDKVERLKLVARIRSVDKLIFTNRRGIKAAEMTSQKLARALANKTVRVIEEGEVLDKALESVIGNLREIKTRQAAAPAEVR